MTTATVVGSGPNGLAAAVVLARRGVEVTLLEAAETPGGGLRSETLPDGLIADHCSAFHPLAQASPFFTGLDLAAHGVRWRWPEIDYAHPLDDGTAALAWRDLATTADRLGPDGRRWTRLLGPVTERVDDLIPEVLRAWPHRPAAAALPALAGFGPRALPPATVAVRLFAEPATRALFTGLAAHAFGRLDRPLTSAIGVMLAAAGHAHGWPVVEGGSQRLADALVAELTDLGGRVYTGVPVRTRRDIPDTDLVLLDTSPETAAHLYGDRMPSRIARSFRRVRRDSAAVKADIVLDGEIGWSAPECGDAGTVHVGGTAEEIAAAEAQVSRGRLPECPFVLVGQQWRADPSRADGSRRPVWAYAHVPPGCDEPRAVDALLAQIERFAPGFVSRIQTLHVRMPRDLEADNPTLVRGDISGGSVAGHRLLFRPRVGLDPYTLGVPGVFLCSSSTPPGAGVHGMCGVNAAHRALRRSG